MGVKGIRRLDSEPKLLGKIDDIIDHARQNGLITNNITDIVAIAKSHNIDVEETELPDGVSGKLERINNRWTISVNNNHSSKRKRFTIAHELAHFFLHKDDNSYFEDTVFFRDRNNSSIEYKANEFAANLLMPEEDVRATIQNGVKSLEEIADKFDVSVLAMKFRLEELGYKLVRSDSE